MRYTSTDMASDPDDAVNFPEEFLNTLNPPGCSTHILELKVGVPIMILRNINPPKLVNGTRLRVDKLLPNVIVATILTGVGKGEVALIPRIPLTPNADWIKRIQFPVRLAFAMSINKAQGQTIKYCGVDLTEPCFSHGQLYVACSRVGSNKNLFVLAKNSRTLNLVHRSVLQN